MQPQDGSSSVVNANFVLLRFVLFSNTTQLEVWKCIHNVIQYTFSFKNKHIHFMMTWYNTKIDPYKNPIKQKYKKFYLFKIHHELSERVTGCDLNKHNQSFHDKLFPQLSTYFVTLCSEHCQKVQGVKIKMEINQQRR